jgi:hypothetical protein
MWKRRNARPATPLIRHGLADEGMSRLHVAYRVQPYRSSDARSFTGHDIGHRDATALI